MEEIEKILLQLSEKVAGRLRKGKQMAKTVAVEVKYNDFIKASRQTTLDRCTDSGTEIYQLSKELSRELWEKARQQKRAPAWVYEPCRTSKNREP